MRADQRHDYVEYVRSRILRLHHVAYLVLCDCDQADDAVQNALTVLFERREGRMLTRAAYRASGGVRGALARRAEELYQGLDAAGQDAARQLFLRLVTLGEGIEDTRRRVRVSEYQIREPGAEQQRREERQEAGALAAGDAADGLACC